MVEEITKTNRHLIPVEAQIFFCKKIHDIPEIQERVNKGAPKTEGCAIFEGVPLTDGRHVFALVEYDIVGLMPGFGHTGIVAITISDRRLPDEFLDRINHYRQSYKEGTVIWYEKEKDASKN